MFYKTVLDYSLARYTKIILNMYWGDQDSIQGTSIPLQFVKK